jgi:hypothetical protein
MKSGGGGKHVLGGRRSLLSSGTRYLQGSRARYSDSTVESPIATADALVSVPIRPRPALPMKDQRVGEGANLGSADAGTRTQGLSVVGDRTSFGVSNGSDVTRYSAPMPSGVTLSSRLASCDSNIRIRRVVSGVRGVDNPGCQLSSRRSDARLVATSTQAK